MILNIHLITIECVEVRIASRSYGKGYVPRIPGNITPDPISIPIYVSRSGAGFRDMSLFRESGRYIRLMSSNLLAVKRHIAETIREISIDRRYMNCESSHD
jgi:hypothetical protein